MLTEIEKVLPSEIEKRSLRSLRKNWGISS